MTEDQSPELVVGYAGSSDKVFNPYESDERECNMCSAPIGWIPWGQDGAEHRNMWRPFYWVGNHQGTHARFCENCWQWLGKMPREVTPVAVLRRAYDGENTRPCPAELFIAADHSDCTECEGRQEVAFRGMRWPILMNCSTCGGDPHPLMPHLRSELSP
jgi:hypothetical protein